jgi:two-component system, chemotaxis family, CheB/CheR fusion protein
MLSADDEEPLEGEDLAHLQKIFVQIRAVTRRDFTGYKRSTVLRRIRRRMQLLHQEQLGSYLALLRNDPKEVTQLSDDLLITVTNFFRDAEVFEALERDVIPQLLSHKDPADRVRIWSIGCATGEEAYSLAILLLEEAGRRQAVPQLQVFATDLHEHSLRTAREGLYPQPIEADVSPERLRRFFVRESGGYRVRKEVREIVLFAPHNLLRDPPFSRLDLISCRNMLIYLESEVQREVLELFHYALNPGAFLLLGKSETVDRSDFFRVESKKICLYRPREVGRSQPRLPLFPSSRSFRGDRLAAPQRGDTLVRWGPLHEKMVERYAPPSLLLNADHHVIHSSEHAGRYLRYPAGEPTTNVFKLLPDNLAMELRTSL